MTALQDAQIAKLEAETAAIKAAAVWAEEMHEHTRTRMALHRRSMEAEARVAELHRDKTEREEKLLLTDWRFSRAINFVGSVQKDTVSATIEKLHQYSMADPGGDITITFNSPGGSVIDGMALFDYIRFLRNAGHKVTIIALGYAASMAGILLQAGDHRVMAKGSWMLIHEVAFSAGGKVGEVEDMFEFGKRLKEQAATIFIERSGGKLSREVLDKNWTRRDWWLSPDEALGLGLIDEIR